MPRWVEKSHILQYPIVYQAPLFLTYDCCLIFVLHDSKYLKRYPFPEVDYISNLKLQTSQNLFQKYGDTLQWPQW